jgi:hypothetical protein
MNESRVTAHDNERRIRYKRRQWFVIVWNIESEDYHIPDVYPPRSDPPVHVSSIYLGVSKFRRSLA